MLDVLVKTDRRNHAQDSVILYFRLGNRFGRFDTCGGTNQTLAALVTREETGHRCVDAGD